ncbi:hypothetical protein ACETAC_07405 [Aceticella autotrophica]|uniref:Lipoprotein n=1 Tax=Aceticella autotrophica TaxID=2755338 RepID=A0A975AUJ7_9THEO|nr:hypothetical protein [Aceticella autotrophica]QSZ26720.1 hypothetical protein ACETAC_07405 [Aceticella autotrophica]
MLKKKLLLLLLTSILIFTLTGCTKSTTLNIPNLKDNNASSTPDLKQKTTANSFTPVQVFIPSFVIEILF